MDWLISKDPSKHEEVKFLCIFFLMANIFPQGKMLGCGISLTYEIRISYSKTNTNMNLGGIHCQACLKRIAGTWGMLLFVGLKGLLIRI